MCKLSLFNNALVIANTKSVGTDPNQQQATITLHSGNLIMRGGSKITGNASGENVIGGNINLDTEVLAVCDQQFSLCHHKFIITKTRLYFNLFYRK
jgi:hypothetical protein